MKNALKTIIGGDGAKSDLLTEEEQTTVAHLGIAPGVVESIVKHATLEVPGVASVGIPKVENPISSVLTRSGGDDGIVVNGDSDSITLDITIQMYYGYKLADIVDGIRINVNDALESQTGIVIDAINIYVSALQFEE